MSKPLKKLTTIGGSTISLLTPTEGGKRPRSSPFKEIGGSGTSVMGGYVETFEKDPRLAGSNRYKTIHDMVINTSIVAAGTRQFLNLLAKPKWSVEPKKENGSDTATAEAQELADFVDEVLNDCVTSWYRVVRKAGLYLFQGFGIQEWTAKRRDDGKIGFQDIESRPWQTIERWDVDAQGTVMGVIQRPAMGDICYIPREKILYLVDDTLTDSPEGIGIFRHCVPDANTLARYKELEMMGFERDMRGIPVGKAPMAKLKEMVSNGQIKEEDYDAALAPLRKFVQMQAKGKATGIIMDSDVYDGMTGDGEQPTAQAKWGIELLTGTPGSSPELNLAVDRLTASLARLIGIEGILLGSGSGGSFALSKDKSSNLYLNVQSCLGCVVEAVNRDLIGALWTLNGFDDALKPKCKTEEVAFKDIEQIVATLTGMAQAGAVLAPDDPAINEVRHIVGLPDAIPYDPTAAAIDTQSQADAAQMDQQASLDAQAAQANHERQMESNRNQTAANKKPKGQDNKSKKKGSK